LCDTELHFARIRQSGSDLMIVDRPHLHEAFKKPL